MNYPLSPNSGRQRQLLDHCRAATKGIPGLDANAIQPRTLRAFYGFKQGNSQLVVLLSGEKAVLAGSETLLSSTRGFVGNLMSVGVAIVPKIAGVEKPGNMRLFSYPHPEIFDNGATGGTTSSAVGSSFGGGASASATTTSELASIRAFFNSLMTFKVNQGDVFEKIPTSRFAIMPQMGAFIPEGLQMIDMQSVFVLSGGNENKVIFDLGDGDTSKIEGNAQTHRLYAAVQIEGYEIVTSNINVRDAALGAIRTYQKPMR
jgi:hypothetical protein